MTFLLGLNQLAREIYVKITYDEYTDTIIIWDLNVFQLLTESRWTDISNDLKGSKKIEWSWYVWFSKTLSGYWTCRLATSGYSLKKTINFPSYFHSPDVSFWAVFALLIFNNPVQFILVFFQPISITSLARFDSWPALNFLTSFHLPVYF